jgi:hypothetical protein
MYTLSLPPHTRLSSIAFSDTTIQTQSDSYSFFLLPIFYMTFSYYRFRPLISIFFYLTPTKSSQAKSLVENV